MAKMKWFTLIFKTNESQHLRIEIDYQSTPVNGEKIQNGFIWNVDNTFMYLGIGLSVVSM